MHDEQHGVVAVPAPDLDSLVYPANPDEPFLDDPVRGADHQRLGDPALAHLAVGQPADQRCRDGASHAGQDAYDH